MSPFFAHPFGLLETAKFALLQILLKAQDHGILSISAIIGLVVLYTARYVTSPYRKLPPGPRGYPIIGNLLELERGQWLKFSKWHKKYGDLIYLNAVGQSIVVLNSQRVAEDLLDRRAAIYSDRPRCIVACDMMSDGLFFGFTGYTDTWRRMRKAAAEGLSKRSVKEFYETHTKEAVLLASELLLDSTEWDAHFQRAAGSMMLSVLYGSPTVTSKKDQTLEAIDDFAKRVFYAALPGAYLVEFFPWLRHVPSRFARWKREVEGSYKKDTDLFEGLVKTAMGGDNQSFSATLIREVERNKLSSRERSWVAGTVYAGSADTSPCVMAWWVLAMLAYPETQGRAQSELDKVVGRARLPTFADYPHLPYIRAMAKEVLRWAPTVPLAAPHVSTEDDWYEGMFIPKGTMCIPNVWHMNRDPEIYGEDASHFNPARYLRAGVGDDGGYTDMSLSGGPATGTGLTGEEGHVTFGFGRRKCVGRHVANNSLFINIAVILWAAKIERKKAASSGETLPLDVDGFEDHGLIVRPIPFECEIVPRFPEASAFLAQERELWGL